MSNTAKKKVVEIDGVIFRHEVSIAGHGVETQVWHENGQKNIRMLASVEQRILFIEHHKRKSAADAAVVVSRTLVPFENIVQLRVVD